MPAYRKGSLYEDNSFVMQFTRMFFRLLNLVGKLLDILETMSEENIK